MRKIGDMAKVDLDALYEEGQRQGDDRISAYKTVATFAGLTKRQLWLKDGINAQTDGHEIFAPFKDPYFYRHVEHELAHILFESNATAKKLFVASYLATTVDSLSKNKLKPLDDDQLQALRDLVSTIVGVLEDARVESLWGLLYPGSYIGMREMHRHQISHLLKASHRSLESFLIVSATDSWIPQGPFSRYLPVFKEALSKVERRGFTATLAVSKWLVQKLVDEALRAHKRLPPPDVKKLASELAQKALGKTGVPPPSVFEETLPDVPLPNALSDAELRRQALDEITESGNNTLASLSIIPNDWDDQKLQPSEHEKTLAKVMVESALGMKVSDDATLNDFLARSEAATTERVEQIREALGQRTEPDVDGWMKDGLGKVALKDVKGSQSIVLAQSDRDAVQRLRTIFYRVLGRRKYTLQESGSAIDVPSYLEGMLTGQPVPCFTSEDRGRGFKVLVLLDRSSSMSGKKTDEAERACRVVSQALSFPFVDLHVWGFQSHNTALNLTRFDRQTMTFTTPQSKVGGNTPMHLALRVATRFMEAGSEAKQIILITDGWPSFTTEQGKLHPKALRGFVRAEVRHARRLGMNVTGVVIGKDKSMDDAGLSSMFGPPANWKRMDSKHLGDGLVRIVSSSFTRYLRNG